MVAVLLALLSGPLELELVLLVLSVWGFAVEQAAARQQCSEQQYA
jgi:hypothetical protein